MFKPARNYYVVLLPPAVGTLVFDTVNSDASVAEGGVAHVCVSISSSATSLGCDLTVTVTTADGKATSEILMCISLVFSVAFYHKPY